jgi:hypothetical protein
LTSDGTVIADRTDTRPLHRVTELADMTSGQAAAAAGEEPRSSSR